jgi:arsenate reductase
VLVIFNDSCSKCADVAERLCDVSWTAVRYLNGELTLELLDVIFSGYEGPISDLVRTGELVWAELGHDLSLLEVDALKALIMKHPVLLQRPIILKQDKVILAREPERVLDALRD